MVKRPAWFVTPFRFLFKPCDLGLEALMLMTTPHRTDTPHLSHHAHPLTDTACSLKCTQVTRQSVMDATRPNTAAQDDTWLDG